MMCLSVNVPMVFAEANDTAIEQVGDWLATVGKSDEDKVRIKAERKTQRAVKKAAKKAKGSINKKMKGSKKGS